MIDFMRKLFSNLGILMIVMLISFLCGADKLTGAWTYGIIMGIWVITSKLITDILWHEPAKRLKRYGFSLKLDSNNIMWIRSDFEHDWIKISDIPNMRDSTVMPDEGAIE
jgi:hypothetical protein